MAPANKFVSDGQTSPGCATDGDAIAVFVRKRRHPPLNPCLFAKPTLLCEVTLLLHRSSITDSPLPEKGLHVSCAIIGVGQREPSDANILAISFK